MGQDRYEIELRVRIPILDRGDEKVPEWKPHPAQLVLPAIQAAEERLRGKKWDPLRALASPPERAEPPREIKIADVIENDPGPHVRAATVFDSEGRPVVSFDSEGLRED